MKKLILISALLSSFNGWAHESQENLYNYSIYYKHMVDTSEDLQRCADMFIGYYSYGSENPSSKYVQNTKPEGFLKAAGEITVLASKIQDAINWPVKLIPTDERLTRTLFYKDILALADKGTKAVMVSLLEDMKYCRDIVVDNQNFFVEE